MAESQFNQQLSMNRQLFLPSMTVQAMRDSRYKHPANAVAELVDNSVDARATHVDVLIQEQLELVTTRQRWRIGKLAVFDNGAGMSAERLAQALQFGGRTPSNRIQQIGKYGMGLPTASVSQCKRVDVWSWQEDVTHPSHCYIDVKSVQSGEYIEIPTPDDLQVPTEWIDTVRRDTLHPRRGTLVVWSDIDRITAQAETIFDRLEKELGRIYRHFIDANELSIRMVAFREGETMPLENRDRTIRPNDPLFLMRNSSSSAPWNKEPMFKHYDDKTFEILVNGRAEAVEVKYSIVKQEALGLQAQNPGSLPHGQDARYNMGVSVVRANREILVDNSFVREGGRGSIPMARWWGCEVRFNEDCDDLFGIDHNKQMVVAFSNAAKELFNSDSDTQEILKALGAADDPIYRIVADIRNTTRNMMTDIELMFSRRKKDRQPGDVDPPSLSAEEEAARLATVSTNDRLDQDTEPQTPTDRDRDQLNPEARQARIQNFLISEGFETEQAISRAEELVRQGLRYSFVAENLQGFNMFHIVNSGGVLFVKLNINHPLYKFLDILEQDVDKSDNPIAYKAAVGIRTLLLAWGRMEDHIEDSEKRMRVQQIASQWGEFGSEFLGQLDDNN